MPELELRPATKADVTPLSQLYAAAFEANPAYRWIFSGSPHEPAPPGALEWLFARRVCLLLHCGCPVLVAVDRGSGALVGAAGLSPFSRKPGMWHFLRQGILLWPLWYGWSSLNRALNIDKKLVSRSAVGRPSDSGSGGSDASSPNGSGDGGSSGSTEHPGNSVSCSSGQNGSDSGHSGPSRDGMDPAGSSGGSTKRGITGEVVMMAVHPTLQVGACGGSFLVPPESGSLCHLCGAVDVQQAATSFKRSPARKKDYRPSPGAQLHPLPLARAPLAPCRGGALAGACCVRCSRCGMQSMAAGWCCPRRRSMRCACTKRTAFRSQRMRRQQGPQMRRRRQLASTARAARQGAPQAEQGLVQAMTRAQPSRVGCWCGLCRWQLALAAATDKHRQNERCLSASSCRTCL